MRLPVPETALDIVVDAGQLFGKRHAGCGGPIVFDLPSLPASRDYRLVMACRCGDTLEEWVSGAVVPRHALADRLTRRTARTPAA